jgi:hypothetical protein
MSRLFFAGWQTFEGYFLTLLDEAPTIKPSPPINSRLARRGKPGCLQVE